MDAAESVSLIASGSSNVWAKTSSLHFGWPSMAMA
jgi:hypothetical protein